MSQEQRQDSDILLDSLMAVYERSEEARREALQQRNSDILLGSLVAVYGRSEEAYQDASHIMDRLRLQDLLINGPPPERKHLEKRGSDNDKGNQELSAFRCLACTPLFRDQLAPLESMSDINLDIVDGRVNRGSNLVPRAGTYFNAIRRLGEIAANIYGRVVNGQIDPVNIEAAVNGVRRANRMLTNSRRLREDSTNSDRGHSGILAEVRSTQQNMDDLLRSMEQRMQTQRRLEALTRVNNANLPGPPSRDRLNPWGNKPSREDL